MTQRRERRRETRVPGDGVRARVRPGHRVHVIDVSAGGALIEVGRPLPPGGRVELQLECDTRRAHLAARVIRCAVAAIDRDRGITYRAALAFNESCSWVCEGATREG